MHGRRPDGWLLQLTFSFGGVDCFPEYSFNILVTDFLVCMCIVTCLSLFIWDLSLRLLRDRWIENQLFTPYLEVHLLCISTFFDHFKCFLCDFSFEIKKNIKNLLQLRCFDCAHPKAGQNTQQTLPRFPLKTTKYPKVLGSPMKRLLNERILSCVQYIISNLKMQNDYVLFLDLYCPMATSNCKLFFSSKLVQL